MRKLIIQIPCYNEEDNLPAVLAALPRSLPGIVSIETLVIDDGSWDRTAEVARACGVNYLVRFPTHLGLAQAFSSGLDAALKLGADIIVNTDADQQYKGSEIAKLVQPILDGTAEMVVGNRRPHLNPEFGPLKRLLQWLGSWVVRQLSGTDVPDATSGFRAFSRRAALKLNVFTKFTYTLETIIQAGKKHLAVRHVLVETNPPTRPSRLFRSVRTYVKHSAATLVRIYALYEPFKIFTRIGGAFLFLGGVIGLRFVYEFAKDGGSGHLQSLILAAVLIIVGFQTLLIGLVADLMGTSRALLEDTLFRVREIELRTAEPSDVVHLEATPDTPRPLVEIRRGPR